MRFANTLNNPRDPQRSWFEPSNLGPSTLTAPDDEAFVRLWQGFMTARVLMALALGLLQLIIVTLGQTVNPVVLMLCAAYVAATLGVRVKARPSAVGQTFGRQWLLTAGVDIAMCSLLQLLQPGTLNYTPLFALPLLLVAVLGSLRLALGTAAGIALLLLAGAAWASWSNSVEAAPRYVEAALVATAYFVMALVVNQLAARLAQEERLARRSQAAAQLQTQVNELVIETLADGVAVVDRDGIARALNPAARALLGSMQQTARVPFGLSAEPGWWPLLDLVQATFEIPRSKPTDVVIDHAAQGPRRLRVRTRLTRNRSASGESLCVLFLHDLREMEARLRTEKLAAMGRMSTAVAHEIRNPLAAIVQANALLDEDLVDPHHKRLTAMVQQNAQRLARITEEVLDISRVQQQQQDETEPPAPERLIGLDAAVTTICAEWRVAARQRNRAVQTQLATAPGSVAFDPEHLRRVLVNLLDNAARYAEPFEDSLQVSCWLSESGQAHLRVWSDGAPLEPAVEQHLFEPFFSSESRSTGLGLYICRELCERHGASMGYRRETALTRRGPLSGNAFVISFRMPALDLDLDVPTQPADLAMLASVSAPAPAGAT